MEIVLTCGRRVIVDTGVDNTLRIALQHFLHYLFEKFGQHQPLNRQSKRYRRKASI
jgi:hypothetical protein